MGHAAVTGCAGFIGSRVTAELLHRGYRACVIDNSTTGSRENVAVVGSDVSLVEGHIRSCEHAPVATKGVDCEIHVAPCRECAPWMTR